MEVVPYGPEWLPGVSALARAHARLVAPGAVPSDDAVARGLDQHVAWPFYSGGMDAGQVRLIVHDGEVIAAAQLGISDHGWGYGAAEGDGPDWLHETHAVVFWLFAWPGSPIATTAATHLAASMVRWARSQGLPGLEAFRGGAGFLQLGAQCSSRWPHLFAPLRTVGFRQPRPLLVYAGRTNDLPVPDADALQVSLRTRRSRIEAWLDDIPCGVCDVESLDFRRREDGLSEYASPVFADATFGVAPDHVGSAPTHARWAQIRRLWVDDEVRNMGVGTALMHAQVTRLAARGFSHWALHLPESAENGPAHTLYSRFGRVIDRQYVFRISF